MTRKKRKHLPRNDGPPNTRIVRASAAMPRAATWTSIVDHGRCEAKGDCVVVCPNDVFEIGWVDDGEFSRLSAFAKLRALVHRRRTAYTPNADACRTYGLCVVACPEGAITLVRRHAAADPSSTGP